MVNDEVRKIGMRKLIEWLEDGKELLGRDEHGEKMYSLTNGASIVMAGIMSAGVVALVIGAVLLVRFVVAVLFGGC